MRFGNRLVRCGSVLLALLTFALFPAAVGATPQGPWVLPAGDLSAAGQNARSPQVTTALDGTTTAVWVRSTGEFDMVQASTRPPGGSFGEPVDLSQTFQNAEDPQIAIAPDGTTTVIWHLNSGTYGVEATTRPPGGSFGAPVDVSGQEVFNSPQITIAPDGTTTVVWTGEYFNRWVVRGSTRPPGGSFGTPVDISETPLGPFPHAPKITTAPDGTTTAIWALADGRFSWTSFVVQASTRPPGGDFGSPVDVSASGQELNFGLDPQIATAPDGTTTALWTSSDGGSETVRASTRPPGGAFGAPVDLSASGQTALVPKITVGPDGTATAAWYGSDGASLIVWTSTRPPGGTFGAPVGISDTGKNSGVPQIATSPDGTTTALWIVLNSFTSISIQASTRPPGGSFASPVDLTANASASEDTLPPIATGPGGTTTAVWVRSDGTNEIVQSASTGFTLSITRSGTGSGSVTSSPAGIDCGSTCSSDFAQGTRVTLNAAPSSGSTFIGWSGAGCSGTVTCQVTIDEAKSVTAAFLRSKATISKLKVIGPGKARKGKKVTYRVKITNSGNLTATGVRLKVSGRGVRFKSSVGKIPAGKTRTVKARFKPKQPVKIKATFKVTSSNAGGKAVIVTK